MDWFFIAVSGFLLGMFFYCGWYSTAFEPEVRWGYAVVGVGIVVSVIVAIYVDLNRHINDWLRGATLLAYALVATGLALIVMARKKERASEQ